MKVNRLKKPPFKVVGFALFIVVWMILEYFFFKYFDGGTLSFSNKITLPIQGIALIVLYIYWLLKVPVKRSSWEVLDDAVYEMKSMDEKLIQQGVKSSYQDMDNGNLIELYKQLQDEKEHLNKVKQSDTLALEIICKLSLLDEILKARNVERWTYDKDNRSMDELLNELVDTMDKLDGN